MSATETMFLQASRAKLRFKGLNGLIGTEDLWDLPLEQLDNIAKKLRKELRDNEESFIEAKKADTSIELRFEIVKFVIETKLAERDKKTVDRDRAARRQVLMEALESKQKAELAGLSAADIQKELDTLDAAS